MNYSYKEIVYKPINNAVKGTVKSTVLCSFLMGECGYIDAMPVVSKKTPLVAKGPNTSREANAMMHISHLVKEHGLTPSEESRLKWVLDTFEPNEYDTEIQAEIKNILAARKIALAPRPLMTKSRAERIRKSSRELTKDGFWEGDNSNHS